jgi:hypothetical protein
MPDARVDKLRLIETVCEVAPGAGVIRLVAPSMAVAVIIDRHDVADVVNATR